MPDLFGGKKDPVKEIRSVIHNETIFSHMPPPCQRRHVAEEALWSVLQAVLCIDIMDNYSLAIA